MAQATELLLRLDRNTMIVCSCFAVTDRDIRAASEGGDDSRCPAGTGCGNCVPAVEAIRDASHRASLAAAPGSDPRLQQPTFLPAQR